MKNKFPFLLLLTFLFNSVSQAQTFPDYQTDAGWVFRSSNASTAAAWQNPAIISNPFGTANSISVDNTNDGLIFNTVTDGDHYEGAEYSLGASMCNEWVTDFDFAPTAAGQHSSNQDAGHILFMYTDGPSNTFRYNSQPWGSNGSGVTTTYPDNDIIGVFFNNKNATNFHVSPFIKDNNNGPTWSQDVIDLGLQAQVIGSKFRIRIERLDAVLGRLTAWKYDGNSKIFIDQVCFDIPPTVMNLNHIQHTNGIHASRHRMLSAKLDNFEFQNCYTIDDCCMPTQISGPTAICDTDERGVSWDYTVLGGGENMTYEWNLANSVRFTGQDENSITVTDWGNTLGPIMQIIEVDIYCGCRFIGTLTMNVLVRPELDASFGINALNAGGDPDDIYDISISIINNPNGSLHNWTLHGGQDCEGVPSGLAPGTPTTSNSNANFMFSGLDEGTTYSVSHTITYADGQCPATYCTYAAGGEFTGGGDDSRYSKSNNTTIYPNPSTGVININYEIADYSNAKIIVKDAIGKTVMEQNISNQNTELSIPTNGVFLVEIWDGEILESVEKVIISE